jgi:hypothetical protein
MAVFVRAQELLEEPTVAGGSGREEKGGQVFEALFVAVCQRTVRKTPSFFSAFPMFVPSLSWQNDRIYI